MRCAGCEAKAAQIADLESELAAWRANDADDARLSFDAARIEAWRRRLKLRQACVQVILHVADRAGRVISWAEVYQASRTDHPGCCWESTDEVRNAYVTLSFARRALVGTPGEGGLASIWGRGVTMAPAVAARLKAWAGETA